MNRNTSICLLLLSALFLPVTGQGMAAAEELPNIVLIMVDDLGYETIGANGGESYETPNLDRLAASGARFEHCYAQPLCTPSRVQIMTGQYNVRNYTTFGELARDQTTFAHLLKKAGYATCIAGKWQLGREPDAPQHFGFDEALLWQHTRDGRLKKDGIRYDKRYGNPLLERNGSKESYEGGEYAPDLMVDFICDFIEAEKDGPFLVYYPMVLTHTPFSVTPDSTDWDPESPGPPSNRGKPRYFGDMVQYMDKLVGRIVRELEQQGLAENTVLLFIGDNGTDKPIISKLNGREVAGAKGKTTDAGTRVPLIAYAPGMIRPAVVSDLVDFSDFLPTLCELAAVDTCEEELTLDGRSFLPQLLGKPGEPREWVYCWYSRKGLNENAKVFARTHRYKLYRDGHFYDIRKDVLEKKPLAFETLNQKQKSVYASLHGVIADYERIGGR